MLSYVMLCYVTLRHVTSRHVTSRHVTSRHVTSHHITILYIIYYIILYYIDELAEVAMMVLPFLLQQKSVKHCHQNFVDFVSVRIFYSFLMNILLL